MDNKRRGKIFLCPMGTGKTFYVTRLANQSPLIKDGDAILELEGVKNRNYFWYDASKVAERQAIINVFERYLDEGAWIFYSGNPAYIKTDVLIIPPATIRRQRLEERRGRDYVPSAEAFEREELAYNQAAVSGMIPIVIRGDIPTYENLVSIVGL